MILSMIQKHNYLFVLPSKYIRSLYIALHLHYHYYYLLNGLLQMSINSLLTGHCASIFDLLLFLWYWPDVLLQEKSGLIILLLRMLYWLAPNCQSGLQVLQVLALTIFSTILILIIMSQKHVSFLFLQDKPSLDSGLYSFFWRCLSFTLSIVVWLYLFIFYFFRKLTLGYKLVKYLSYC